MKTKIKELNDAHSKILRTNSHSIPVEIKKFNRPEFGSLTTLTNLKTGVIMFIAAEAGRMWGHSNITSVTRKLLNSDELKTIKKSGYQLFFDQLVSNHIIRNKAQRIQLITESGLYKFALASNLEKAKPFRDWITQEVLPSIRKTGQYVLLNQYDKLSVHKDTNIQKFNSKAINAKNFIEKGLDAVIDYNRESCILHTGKTPSQLKKIGHKMGLTSKETSSGKEVLRHIEPEKAAAMSLTDSLVKEGYPLKTCAELSLKGLPLFRGMIELGIKP